MNICLVNDAGIADADFNNLVSATTSFVPRVTKAWGLGNFPITSSTKRADGAWNVILTDKNRKVGATGFHTIENGVPVAYCSPKAAARLYGHYTKPLVIKGKTVHGALYTEGLVTTICHEIAEMLCDQKLDKYAADATGKPWLVEVCDHVFGSYLLEVVNGNACVLPDVTMPAFYDINGKAPYSLNNAVSAPFTLTPKGYGYGKGPKGLVKL